MIRIASALIVGLIFGIGVVVSGMMNPAKVLGFLDLREVGIRHSAL
jgi:uncharacterized protein